MTTYAIVSDVTPSRCNINRVVESDGTALDVARQQDVGLHRVMPVAGGVSTHNWRRARAWHDGRQITGIA
jgi:hypothetical protein